MCVACKEMKEKEQLFRIVKKNGEFPIDVFLKIQGRGAYVCRSLECIEKAEKRRAFERSFSCKVDGEIYTALKDLVCDAEREN